MKKFVICAVVIGGLSAMYSCKKDNLCRCDVLVLGTSVGTWDTTLVGTKKSDAETTCTGFEVNVAGNGLENCTIQ